MPVRSHHHGAHHGGNSDWRLRSYGRTRPHSMLNGATELAKVDNDIEEPSETTRTVETDGRKVHFELLKSVTKRPKTDRQERMQSDWTNINVHKSRYVGRIGHRTQRWLTTKDPIFLTVLYLFLYLGMNAGFAMLWYFLDEEGRCCEDGTMTFAQVFDFAVQTSSTIGYGGYWPKGYLNNALVVIITLMSIVLSTVYAGLLFFKFITPQANIEFSDVIAMSNVLGEPCLEIRIGNADGKANALINGEANLWVTSVQQYRAPGEFAKRKVVQTENLHLAVSQVPKVNGVWTIRHFIDEHSPLYGLRLDEFPATTIYSINLNFKAIQVITKGEVFSQTAYQVQDIMVGYCFEELSIWDPKTRSGQHDYAKLSETKPSFVWYPNPAEVNDYEDIRLAPPSWNTPTGAGNRTWWRCQNAGSRVPAKIVNYTKRKKKSDVVLVCAHLEPRVEGCGNRGPAVYHDEMTKGGMVLKVFMLVALAVVDQRWLDDGIGGAFDTVLGDCVRNSIGNKTGVSSIVRMSTIPFGVLAAWDRFRPVMNSMLFLVMGNESRGASPTNKYMQQNGLPHRTRSWGRGI